MPLNNPVELFKANPDAFGSFLRALSTLHSTGVLELLREQGRVVPISANTPNFVDVQASMSNWSLGWNQALDALVYFKERYLADQEPVSSKAPMDFGALEKNLENGNLTLEEVEALRDGRPIPELKRESVTTVGTGRKASV